MISVPLVIIFENLWRTNEAWEDCRKENLMGYLSKREEGRSCGLGSLQYLGNIFQESMIKMMKLFLSSWKAAVPGRGGAPSAFSISINTWETVQWSQSPCRSCQAETAVRTAKLRIQGTWNNRKGLKKAPSSAVLSKGGMNCKRPEVVRCLFYQKCWNKVWVEDLGFTGAWSINALESAIASFCRRDKSH